MPSLFQLYGVDDLAEAPQPHAAEKGDLVRGFKESFQQLPQLGWGVVAGAGTVGEAAFGEGGIATGIKKAGVEGYQRWADKIAADTKASDSFNTSWDLAKEGDFGALADWLQHGIGYVGGQGLQMLATGGIGAAAGKWAIGTAAKDIAKGMVLKEASQLAGTAAGKQIARDELIALATRNVASRIGQTTALAATAVGMEGGEIFGGLVSEAETEGRQLTGTELGRAFAATLGAGALEFVGDKVGLDVVLGRSKLLKPTDAMTGMSGRLARGGVAAAGAAPIEAGTEFGQTLTEEWGKGKDPLSPESIRQAQDAAALGAVGGTVIGGAGAMLHSPRPVVAPHDEAMQRLAQATDADTVIESALQAVDTPLGRSVEARPPLDVPLTEVSPEQAIMRMEAQAQRDSRLNVNDWSALAGAQPMEPEADWLKQARETALADQQQTATEQRVRQEIMAPAAASTTLPELPGGRTFERGMGNISADADAVRAQQQKAADLERLPADAAAQDVQQAAVQRAATVEAPTAMQLAMQRASAPGSNASTTPGTDVVVDTSSAPRSSPAAEPRIVERTPDMRPMSRLGAEQQAAAMPGAEVVRIQNKSGKFAYTVLLPEQAAIRPNDLKTQDGLPYGTRAAATIRSRKDGGQVVEVPSGFVVRPNAPVAQQAVEEGKPKAGLQTTAQPLEAQQVDEAAPDVAGDKINREWTAFAPDSGTLSIPRAEMPQIKAEHRGAMVQFLKGRGITHESASDVPADSLKPTQAEFSPGKVAQAKDFEGGDRSILVSADGHVLDGHHQWMAKRETGEPVSVIRLNAPIKQLLSEVREFPSAGTEEGGSSPQKGFEPAARSTSETSVGIRPASTVPRGSADRKGFEPTATTSAEVPTKTQGAGSAATLRERVDAMRKRPHDSASTTGEARQRPAALIDALKRESVLESLLRCLG